MTLPKGMSKIDKARLRIAERRVLAYLQSMVRTEILDDVNLPVWFELGIGGFIPRVHLSDLNLLLRYGRFRGVDHRKRGFRRRRKKSRP